MFFFVMQVKSSVPLLLPPLGEADIRRTDIFRHANLIVDAKKMLRGSEYSHLVARTIPDRVSISHSIFSLVLGF